MPDIPDDDEATPTPRRRRSRRWLWLLLTPFVVLMLIEVYAIQFLGGNANKHFQMIGSVVGQKAAPTRR